MSVNTKFLKLTNGPVQKDGPLIKRVNGNDPVLRGLEDFFSSRINHMMVDALLMADQNIRILPFSAKTR